MIKMKIDLPLDQMPNVDRKRVLKYLQQIGLVETVINYIIDWRTRRQVTLKRWISSKECDLPIDVISKTEYIKELPNNDLKAKAILKFVKENISYKKDQEIWGVVEKWQTPEETWNLKTGDCEDGAILGYKIAEEVGIPDFQIYITAGLVMGGGHCYLVYVSDRNGLEYPIDWCYWYVDSYKMYTNYAERSTYINGEQEWFRFNSSGHFKLWKK